MTKISSNFYFSNANYLSLYNLFLFKKFLPALISHLSLNEHLNLFPSFISILIILSDLKLIYKIFYSFILTISQLSYINNITSGSQLFYLLPLSKHPPKQKTLVLSFTQPSLQLAQLNQEASPTEKTVNSLSICPFPSLVSSINSPQLLVSSHTMLCNLARPCSHAMLSRSKYPGESPAPGPL